MQRAPRGFLQPGPRVMVNFPQSTHGPQDRYAQGWLMRKTCDDFSVVYYFPRSSSVRESAEQQKRNRLACPIPAAICDVYYPHTRQEKVSPERMRGCMHELCLMLALIQCQRTEGGMEYGSLHSASSSSLSSSNDPFSPTRSCPWSDRRG